MFLSFLVSVFVVEFGAANLMFKADPFSSPQLTPNIKLSFGDIALTPEQELALMKGEQHGYNAVIGAHLRWENAIIPYVIDCSIENNKAGIEAIEKAMAQWERKTCIRFVKHTTEKYFLTFFRNTHCWGNVGQVSYSRISVGYGCEFEHVMAHEIGHVVGLYHEQNRKDRDNWVKVHWENIGQFRDAFEVVQNTDPLGIDYDYESIMHYPWNAFSSNGKITMEPIRPTNGKVPYIEISKDDIRLVSRMYNCPAIERRRRRQGRFRRRFEKRGVNGTLLMDVMKASNALEDSWPNRNYLGVGVICQDTHPNCEMWATKQDQCRLAPGYMLRACMKSCKKLNFDITCDLQVPKPPGACANPLGVGLDASGNKVLPDSAFSSSSDLSPGGGWVAPSSAARLYNSDNFDTLEIGSWCANSRRDGYLQVDLGQRKRITFIATQGRPKYFERIEKFKIQYGDHPAALRTYQENRRDRVFNGNCDISTPVLNQFRRPITARIIRYIPVNFNWPCLRMELFGC